MIWKEYVKDKRYEVSDEGLVRRQGGRVRRPSSTPTGYRVIVFSNPGGRFVGRYVHRMVMETFIGPCPEGKEVSHINGDNTDNRLCNLEYATRKQNLARKVEHGTDNNGARNSAAKLTKQDVLEIRMSDKKYKDLAAIYGVSIATIGRAKTGVSWRDEYP